MPLSVRIMTKTVRDILDESWFIKHSLPIAWYRAECDRLDGFPTRNGEILGIVSSEISDLTANIALGPPDQIERSQKQAIEHLQAAQRHIAAAKRQMLFLTGLDHETAQRIAEEHKRKSSECSNCERLITGSRDDRSIGGRCDTCYRYYKKHQRERPQEYDRTKQAKRTFVPENGTR